MQLTSPLRALVEPRAVSLLERNAFRQTLNNREKPFWEGKTIDHDYWRLYLNRRPKYDQKFYDMIFKFHREGSVAATSKEHMRSSCAHDIATGPGQVAAYLAKRFSSVIASDAQATHVLSAHNFNSSPNITYAIATGQALPKAFPRGSAELVTIAEALPLMPIEPTIQSVTHLLRPSGTLAIWFYGRPHFAPHPHDPQFDAGACNEVYGQIATTAFRNHFGEVAEEQRKNIQTTMASMWSWLDHVKLPEDDWANVMRYKWNKGLKMEFINNTDPLLGWKTDLGMGPRDDLNVNEMLEEDMWSEMWTVKGWQEFLSINLPPGAGDEHVRMLETQWKRLTELMGGKEVERKVRWPVVLILATRK